jgi:hypothetical protein
MVTLKACTNRDEYGLHSVAAQFVTLLVASGDNAMEFSRIGTANFGSAYPYRAFIFNV